MGVRMTWLVALCIAVMASGIGVVYAKNQSRALFVEMQKVRTEKDLAVREWGRLQLELAAEGGLDEVLHTARKQLQMRVPAPDDIVVVD